MLLLYTTILVVFMGTAMGGSPIDSLDEDQKEMLKMLHDSCVGETGTDEGLIQQAIKGDFADDDKLKAYMACIFMQLGAMDEEGVPDLDTMISMLPESMQERGGKMIGSCKGVSGSGAPDTALKLNQCFYKADPDLREYTEQSLAFWASFGALLPDTIKLCQWSIPVPVTQ